MSYSSNAVWVNITRPIFTDNVGIVRYSPALIDGKYFSRPVEHHFNFKAIDASGNSATCKISVFVGGKSRGCMILMLGNRISNIMFIYLPLL